MVTAAPRSKTDTRNRTKQPRLWHVILLDDDHHTYEYVIEMMMLVFAHSIERGFEIAETVDSEGRAICLTTHLELAELKREQMTSLGPDPRMEESAGPMTVLLEPADEGDDA